MGSNPSNAASGQIPTSMVQEKRSAGQAAKRERLASGVPKKVQTTSAKKFPRQYADFGYYPFAEMKEALSMMDPRLHWWTLDNLQKQDKDCVKHLFYFALGMDARKDEIRAWKLPAFLREDKELAKECCAAWHQKIGSKLTEVTWSDTYRIQWPAWKVECADCGQTMIRHMSGKFAVKISEGARLEQPWTEWACTLVYPRGVSQVVKDMPEWAGILTDHSPQSFQDFAIAFSAENQERDNRA